MAENMRKGKKGQIEIVGLLIIVLIISFILLFVFSNMLKEDDGISDEFENNEMVGSFISAMIYTNTDCNPSKITMMELIKECARFKKGGSAYTSTKCTGNKDPCTFINETIDEMLNASLWNWSRPYEFVIKSDSTTLTRIKADGPREMKDSYSATQPLTVSRVPEGVIIYLCIPRCILLD